MAGFLGDGWEDPRSAAVMALAGGMLKGDFGGGLMGSQAAYGQARKGLLDARITDAQLRNYDSEIEARKLKTIQDQRKQAMLSGLFGPAGADVPGGSAQPPAMGPLGSGSYGAVPPPAGMPAIPQAQPTPQQGGFMSRLNPEMLARLKLGADADLTDIYKLGQPKWENVGGNWVNTNDPAFKGGFTPQVKFDEKGGATMLQPGANGIPTASIVPGSLDAYTKFREADAGVAAKNKPMKVFNPATQREEYTTESQVVQSAQPAPMMRPNASEAGMRAQMSGGMGADPMAADREIQKITASLPFVKDPASRQLLQEQLADLQRQKAAIPAGPLAAGPSVSETTRAAADKEQAVATAKDVAEQRKSIMNAGFAAPTNIAKYQQIGKLLADVDGGTLTPAGTHLASTMNSLGFKVDKNLPNKEAAAALANEAALQLRSPAGGAGMPGAMSDSDRTFLASMTPSMGQSAQGRKQVIDAYVSVQQRNQQVADFARKYEKKYGKLDNGFFDQLSAWSTSNPLFKAK